MKALASINDEATKWLCKSIIAQEPRIGSTNISDYERVCLIRQWMVRNCPVASKGNKLHKWVDNYDEASLGVTFQQFHKGEGGLSCGGLTNLANQLYAQFGYLATSYNMGVEILNTEPLYSTHVVSLVKIDHKGSAIFTIQDALYDFSLENKDGSPLSFDHLIDLLISSRASEVKINSELQLKRRYIDHKDGSIAEWPQRPFQDVLGDRIYATWLSGIFGFTNILYGFLFQISCFPEIPELANAMEKAADFISHLTVIKGVEYWQGKLNKLELTEFPRIHYDIDVMKRELLIKDGLLANTRRMITDYEQRVSRLKDVYAQTRDNETGTKVSGE